MKNIKINCEMLIDSTNHEAGSVVSVTDVRAADLVRQGFATKEGDSAPQVIDAISPVPQDGVNEPPTPTVVADNPGLTTLEIATKNGAPRKAAKLSGKAE